MGGTGLGLAICKRLCQLMGGSISLKSTPGTGTTFSVDVPLDLTEQAPIATDLDDLAKQVQAQATGLTPLSVDEAEARGCLIGMVDDHPINRYVLSRQLSLLGYTYVTAEDGLQALEMSRKHKLALLITDCQMPGMDGYQLARSIREDEAKSGRAALPILACTASALQGEAEKCAAAGMSDYMTKPLQVPVLAGMLKKWGPNMQALATPSTATELPIDTQYWERQTAGDEELKAMLADQFIATSQTDLEALHDMALNNQDVARAQAHRIKGAAVAVGARQLGRLCEELEAAFTQHNQAETKRLIAALDAEMNAVVSWLGKQTHQPAPSA